MPTPSIYSAAILLLADAVNSQLSNDQGPVALYWPPDRRWGAVADNIAPCGSEAGIGNRTEFPLTGGKLEMTIQDESYNITVSLSYSSDPTTNEDFEEVVPDAITPDFESGHGCWSVPDAREGVQAGANATFQLQYTSQFDNPENETFYACADIRFVESSSFVRTGQQLCFNTSSDAEDATSAFNNNPAHMTATLAPTATSSVNTPSSSVGSGLSGGAIAGIVVGSIVGAALIGALLFFAFKRYHRGVKRNAEHTYRMDNLASPIKKTGDSGSERT